jgi:hypothetical protein
MQEKKRVRERKANKIKHETTYKNALKRKSFQEDRITDELKRNIR